MLRRVLDAIFNKPTAYSSNASNDLRSDPRYRAEVAEHLERAGVIVANGDPSRPGVTYLPDGNLSTIFKNDAARQPHDRNRRDNPVRDPGLRDMQRYLRDGSA